MILSILLMFSSMMLSNFLFYKDSSINGMIGMSMFMSLCTFGLTLGSTFLNAQVLDIFHYLSYGIAAIAPIGVGISTFTNRKSRPILKVTNITPKLSSTAKKAKESVKALSATGEPKAVTFTKPDFNEEDMKAIKLIESTMSLDNATSITKFGLDTQKAFSKLNDCLVEMVQSCLSITLTENLSMIMAKIQKFDGEDLSIIKEIMDDVSVLVVNVEEGQDDLETYVGELNVLFVRCQEIVKQIDRLLEAGQQCLINDNKKLDALREEYAKTQDMMVFNDISEFTNNSGRLEKKLSNLQFTKMSAAHFSIQLKSIQNNERHFIDDIYNVIHNVIPVWKNKVSLSVNNQKQKSYGLINEEIKDSILDADISSVNNDMLDIDVITDLNRMLLNNIENLVKTSTATHKNYNKLYNDSVEI